MSKPSLEAFVQLRQGKGGMERRHPQYVLHPTRHGAGRLVRRKM
jgi:hypothetical protein